MWYFSLMMTGGGRVIGSARFIHVTVMLKRPIADQREMTERDGVWNYDLVVFVIGYR